jgi:hypothetical protein
MQLYAPLGYACYTFDAPGFGGSYNSITAPNIAYYVHTFAKVFADMGLFTEGFHLIGHTTQADYSLLRCPFSLRMPCGASHLLGPC